MSTEPQSFQIETGSPEQRIASTHYIELVTSGDHWQIVTPREEIKLCELVIDTISLLHEDKRTAADAAALRRASDWVKQHSVSRTENPKAQEANAVDEASRHRRALLSQRYPSADTMELDRMQLRLARRLVPGSTDLDLIANQAMKGKLSAEREGTRLFINAILGDRYR